MGAKVCTYNGLQSPRVFVTDPATSQPLFLSLFPFSSRYWPPKNSGFLTYQASPHLRAFALVVSYNCTTSGPDIHMVASLMAFHEIAQNCVAMPSLITT